jgi:hypothetical protein
VFGYQFYCAKRLDANCSKSFEKIVKDLALSD